MLRVLLSILCVCERVKSVSLIRNLKFLERIFPKKPPKAPTTTKKIGKNIHMCDQRAYSYSICLCDETMH